MPQEESLTTAGLTALQDALSMAMEREVSTIQIGTGRTAPDLTDTAVETPFAPVKSFPITAELDITTGMLGSTKLGLVAEDRTIGPGTDYEFNELCVFLDNGVLLYRIVETDPNLHLGVKTTTDFKLFVVAFDIAPNLMAAVTFPMAAMRVGIVDRAGIIAFTNPTDRAAGTRTDRATSVADVMWMITNLLDNTNYPRMFLNPPDMPVVPVGARDGDLIFIDE